MFCFILNNNDGSILLIVIILLHIYISFIVDFVEAEYGSIVRVATGAVATGAVANEG